jgi:histidyl-tRNA synthetase
MEKIKPRIFSGTRDFLPEEMLQREQIIETIKSAFRRYGFLPLETPALEFLDILLGKYGEEGDRMIYRLAYEEGETLALRYDLTVPLSRLVAMYQGQLQFPFKRYQIQPVWRADRPQIRQGRFREFYQCDADTVGSDSMLADAEIIALTSEILNALGFRNFVIRVNHRRILRAITLNAGLRREDEAAVCRCIDKLDKIGLQGVRKEMLDAGFSTAAVERVFKVLELTGEPEELLEQLASLLGSSEGAEEGIGRTRELLDYVARLGVKPYNYRFDLYLARGLDYYTGPIFESILPEQPHIGSLTGGGRYDDLIGLYSGIAVPATGTTIGLDRIFEAMGQLGMLSGRKTTTKVLVVNFGGESLQHSLALAGKLRSAGIATEVYFEEARIKKQISYADRKGIPFVAIIGEEEAKSGSVSIKTLASGEQVTLPLAEALKLLGNELGG